MIKRLILILCLFVVIFGCIKEDTERLDYIAGEILISVFDTSSFQRIYKLIDSLKLHIKELYDYGYYIKSSVDSVEIIKSILSSKSYLIGNGKTYSARYIDSTIELTVNFFDLYNNDANDWFQAIELIGLSENLTFSFNKWGVLRVPKGKEQFYIDRLKQSNIIKSASLNHFVEPID